MRPEDTEKAGGDCHGVDGEVTRVWIPSGVVVYLRGAPFKLVGDAQVETHPANLEAFRLQIKRDWPQ